MSVRCYGTDGAPDLQNRYIPCNTTAVEAGGHSTCCARDDRCMSNGLCQAGSDMDKGANLFWRNGCTDPSWQDAACAKYCMGLDRPDTQAVYYCLTGTEWCCMPREKVQDLGAVTNTTCCSISDLTFAAPSPVVAIIAQDANMLVSRLTVGTMGTSTTVRGIVSTGGAAQSTMAGGTAASTTGAGGLGSPTAGSSSGTAGSNSDSKMGIYVGVPLGILLAIALGVIAWLVWKRKQDAKTRNVVYEAPAYGNDAKYPSHPEICAVRTPLEMSGEREVYSELPNSRVR